MAYYCTSSPDRAMATPTLHHPWTGFLQYCQELSTSVYIDISSLITLATKVDDFAYILYICIFGHCTSISGTHYYYIALESDRESNLFTHYSLHSHPSYNTYRHAL